MSDDHPIVLQGFDQLLAREPDVRVLALCRTGEETLAAVREHQPDVLVLDLHMPGMGGLAVLRELQKEPRPPRVVLLAAEVDEDERLEAIQLGVRGVILKEVAPWLLVQCIRKVHAGGQWPEHRSVGRTLDGLPGREARGRPLAGTLTPREVEIARLVAHGVRTRAIAQTLAISEGTVKVHLHHVYEKLQVDGRLALTVAAREKGLV